MSVFTNSKFGKCLIVLALTVCMLCSMSAAYVNYTAAAISDSAAETLKESENIHDIRAVYSAPDEKEDPDTSGMLECGEGEAAAYIMYTDSSNTNLYRYDGGSYTLKAENVKVTGEGEYIVELTSEVPVSDITTAALCIDNGEMVFPGYIFTITAVTVDGESIRIGKSYTYSDGSTTRVNIFDTPDYDIPANARCLHGDPSECTSQVVSQNLISNWTELRVCFTCNAPDGTDVYLDQDDTAAKEIGEEVSETDTEEARADTAIEKVTKGGCAGSAAGFPFFAVIIAVLFMFRTRA